MFKKPNAYPKVDLSQFVFFKATTKEEKNTIDLFLNRCHNRGCGSTAAYRAYFAATYPPDGRPLIERIVAVAKICPLHTPSAAKFFAGPGNKGWRHVYCLQRLGVCRAPYNLLSKFLAWCFKDAGLDNRIWYIATYADPFTAGPDGMAHLGFVYRSIGMTYCGISHGGNIEGYKMGGAYHSMRKGKRTLRLSDIPPGASIKRSTPKHRYCKAVGPPLARAFRQRDLDRRMAQYIFQPIHQPSLLCELLDWIKLIWRLLQGWLGDAGR
jgi:hypothetical protein